jgi:hypothetical protein
MTVERLSVSSQPARDKSDLLCPKDAIGTDWFAHSPPPHRLFYGG